MAGCDLITIFKIYSKEPCFFVLLIINNFNLHNVSVYFFQFSKSYQQILKVKCFHSKTKFQQQTGGVKLQTALAQKKMQRMRRGQRGVEGLGEMRFCLFAIAGCSLRL
jgi:hypothetical protein